jgi:GNAT superfamily N-acetyltransferase
VPNSFPAQAAASQTARIYLAETDHEIAASFPLMKQLRPHLEEKDFVARVRRQMREGGFQLLLLEDRGAIQSLAGFRLSESLYYGRFLYVDDLVTDEGGRRQGYAGMLFDWLLRHSKEHACDALVLDSGVQRFAAHRFYLAHGLDITCHHFAVNLR